MKLATPLATLIMLSTGILLPYAYSPVMAEDSPTRDASYIATQAKWKGDPQRGAILFHMSAAACARCHASHQAVSPLGPSLISIPKETSELEIVESILNPSKSIRKGFETLTVVTTDGELISGLVASETPDELILRDAKNLEQEMRIAKTDIESRKLAEKSMMPDGLADTFASDRDLYDLVRYVIEVARGGTSRAQQLQPDPQSLIVRDDLIDLDHAGILRSLNPKDFEAGEQIYQNQCKTCHGPDGNTPSLPTARAFGSQPLKYGADPYQMLRTLTHGAGLMTPMQQLSPKQRYQVIHFLREAFMKDRNPDYRPLDEQYLQSLPKGSQQGNEVVFAGQRDYGPVLGSQIGSTVNNALTFRLPHQVTVSYDLHRMRLAGAWTGGFLDLSQTHHYLQRGEQMPKIDGDRIPGLSAWQWAFQDSFEIPRDAKPPRGPVQSQWLQYHGHYLHDQHAVLSYQIHGRPILESIQASLHLHQPILLHTLRVEAGNQPLKLSVAQLFADGSPQGLVNQNNQLLPLRSGPATNHIALVSGNEPGRQSESKMANRPLHVVPQSQAETLDLGTPGHTTLVRFRTTSEGTLIASAPTQGPWKPNGKSLFIRGNRLVFDIGWVGAITSQSIVNDGEWHIAALVVSEQETQLFLDAKLEASRPHFRRDPEPGHVLKIGATASNFGGDFTGDIDWISIQSAARTPEDLAPLNVTPPLSDPRSLFFWTPPAPTTSTNATSTNANSTSAPKADPHVPMAAAIVVGDTSEMTWDIDESGRITLTIPPSSTPRLFAVIRTSSLNQPLEDLCSSLHTASKQPLIDPRDWTHGGPLRWPQILEVHGKLGEPINGYALDTIPIPFENPWNAWIRTSSLDFFEDGRAVVTTHGGDVYIVRGLDDRLEHVQWKRFAAGLFEPFGVRVVNGLIYVMCRDGIKRLHDLNHDGEADWIEAFWTDDDVSSSFHAYNFDLQTDSTGHFYFAKAGQYTQHHRPGTIMRIPPEGGRAEVVAWGLRTPNGMGKLNDDQFTVSDNQGPWMPAGKISLIQQDRFFGNMPITDEQTQWLKQKHGGSLPTSFDEPIVWLPQELDNSSGGQVWIDDPRFGPLANRLIHSSFGKGWLYYLALQNVSGTTQASIVALPHQWDAGVMRLRANPFDGQLYGTGLSGWQGPPQGKDGCLQRLRYTRQPMRMIESSRVIPGGIELRFQFSFDPKSACDPKSWNGEMWNYLWSQQYGSDQFSVLHPGQKGRDPLTIQQVLPIDDHTLQLRIPNLQVCDQLLLNMDFLDRNHQRFIEQIYLTIHAIPTE